MSYYRRKRRLYNEPGHAHFLTFSCQHRLPLLNSDRCRSWFIESLQHARSKHRMGIIAYVIMPEHAHLLVQPRDAEYDIGRFQYDLKRPVSTKAKRHLVLHNGTRWLTRLTDEDGAFRFWLPGGGYDENIIDRQRIILTAYIHGNPVRRELVQRPADWIWSSARFWQGDKSVPLLMDEVVI